MAQRSATDRIKSAVRPFRFAAVVFLIVVILLLTYLGAAGATIWLSRRGIIPSHVAWNLENSFCDPIYMYIRTDGPGAWMVEDFLRLCGWDG